MPAAPREACWLARPCSRSCFSTTCSGLAKYAFLHFCVFAAIGIGAALFFQRGSVAVNTLTGALYGIVACSAAFYTGIALLTGGFLATPDWRLVVGANAVAGVIMVANLLGDRDAAC